MSRQYQASANASARNQRLVPHAAPPAVFRTSVPRLSEFNKQTVKRLAAETRVSLSTCVRKKLQEDKKILLQNKSDYLSEIDDAVVYVKEQQSKKNALLLQAQQCDINITTASNSQEFFEWSLNVCEDSLTKVNDELVIVEYLLLPPHLKEFSFAEIHYIRDFF